MEESHHIKWRYNLLKERKSDMDPNAIANELGKRLELPYAIVLAFIITLPFFGIANVLHSNTHEIGHYIGCVISTYLEQGQVVCGFSAKREILVWSGISLPALQQTSGGTSSWLFIFGGPLLGSLLFVLSFWLLSWLIWERALKRKLVLDTRFWLIPVWGFLDNLLNIFCGTDNLTKLPLGFCLPYQVPVFGLSSLFCGLAALWLVFPVAKEISQRLFGARTPPAKTAGERGIEPTSMSRSDMMRYARKASINEARDLARQAEKHLNTRRHERGAKT